MYYEKWVPHQPVTPMTWTATSQPPPYTGSHHNIVTHCGIGRLVTQCFIESDNTGSFVFRPTKEKGLLVGTRDVELNDVENVSHELRFQTIESLENVINLLTKFCDKWRADQ